MENAWTELLIYPEFIHEVMKQYILMYQVIFKKRQPEYLKGNYQMKQLEVIILFSINKDV